MLSSELEAARTELMNLDSKIEQGRSALRIMEAMDDPNAVVARNGLNAAIARRDKLLAAINVEANTPPTFRS